MFQIFPLNFSFYLDVDIVFPHSGDTPLHCASKCGFPLIVKLLLDAGATVQNNSSGQSPKDVAVTSAITKLFDS